MELCGGRMDIGSLVDKEWREMVNLFGDFRSKKSLINRYRVNSQKTSPVLT